MKKDKVARIVWQVIHWVIIANFLFEIVYGMAQIFFVLIPPGGSPGPLFGASSQISFELITARRLYAIETWIAIAGLAIYLAIVYRKKIAAALWGKAAEKEIAKSDDEKSSS